MSFCLASKLTRFTSLRGQTVHSQHCKRNPQQANIRFVAESATLLLFFDLLCCFEFHKQIPKSLYRYVNHKELIRRFAMRWVLNHPQPNDSK